MVYVSSPLVSLWIARCLEMDAEAFHAGVFLAEWRDGEVVSCVETQCVLIGFGENRQPGRNGSTYCSEQMSADADSLRVRCCRDVQQGDPGVTHGVANDADDVAIDDTGEEDRCGIVPVPLDNVLQSLLTAASGQAEQTDDRGVVVDRCWFDLNNVVAHNI
jgi:hypothetical protein